MTENYINEGYAILEVLDKYFPKQFEGRDSILWLHKHSTQQQQYEWAAFFFEQYCFPLLTHFLGGWKGPRITKSSRFDYQREFVWDLKLKANLDKNGKSSDWILLNDKEATDRIINIEGGIGYIIASVNFSFDVLGNLQRWRDKLEGNDRKNTSKDSRMLKKNGKITNIYAIFIKDQKQVQQAIESGWIGVFNQGRNQDGSPRQPKYKINIKKTPKSFFIE